jgi:hypothetical protein
MLKLPYLGMEEISQDRALISKQLLAEFTGTLILVSSIYRNNLTRNMCKISVCGDATIKI